VVKGAKAEQLFNTRGLVDSLRFSPDGKQLAFVCTRVDHSFVGVYTFADHTLRWIDASFSLDIEPRWSPDGTRIAFVRTPWTHDEVGLIPHRTGFPWSMRPVGVDSSRSAGPAVRTGTVGPTPATRVNYSRFRTPDTEQGWSDEYRGSSCASG
jgi:Tol biopolymer transport system component